MDLTKHLARFAVTTVAASTLVGGASLTAAHACDVGRPVSIRNATPLWEGNNNDYASTLRFEIDGLDTSDWATFETVATPYAQAGSDYVITKGTVTGGTGYEYANVKVVADTVDEINTELVSVRLTGVSGCNSIGDGSAVAQIFDDDDPDRIANAFSGAGYIPPSATAKWVPVNVRLSLSRRVTADTKLTWRTEAGSLKPDVGYIDQPAGTAMVAANDRDAWATVYVRNATQCNESFDGSFTVRLTSAPGATINDATATVTIDDNTIICPGF